MRILYHSSLCPFSRKVRIVLGEKGLEFDLKPENYWERRPEFLALNPAGQIPVLIEEDGKTALSESAAICEYLDESYPDRPIIGFDPAARVEARRLANWFDLKFYSEVGQYLLNEKVHKRIMGGEYPDSKILRAALRNLTTHLKYINWLLEDRTWLAGQDFSIADIAAAAHLSCIDYIGDVPWADHEPAKQWYARMKSRPSFRALLADFISGMPPPKHYADLDF